jgi:hypothetical protein
VSRDSLASRVGSCGSSLSDDGTASWSSSPQSSRKSSLANSISCVAAKIRDLMGNYGGVPLVKVARGEGACNCSSKIPEKGTKSSDANNMCESQRG